MKKFVSIFTVVAMVAALSTSAFASENPSQHSGEITDPVVVDPTEEYNNEPSTPDEGTTGDDGTTTQIGGGGAGGQNAANAGGEGGATAAGDQGGVGIQAAGGAAGGAAAGTDAAGGATGGAAGAAAGTQAGADADDDDEDDPAAATADPTAKAEDVEADSPAAKAIQAFADGASIEELAEIIEMDVPTDWTQVSNWLLLKTAKGVKVKKVPEKEVKDNKITKATVGQNQLTKDHKEDELFVILLPVSNDPEKKPEKAEVKLDKAGNITFETTYQKKEAIFAIFLDTEK